MKARMPAGFGRPDMNSLMRQAQKMQEDMKAKQAELEAAEYTAAFIKSTLSYVIFSNRRFILHLDHLLPQTYFVSSVPSCF